MSSLATNIWMAICWAAFVAFIVGFCIAMTQADHYVQVLCGASLILFAVAAVVLLNAAD